jgi:hypothetical protein
MTATVDHSLMKLGRRAIKTDTRTLRVENYFSGSLPPPPESVTWSSKVCDWGMLLNDQLGDCTIAGALHLDMAWAANAGGIFVPTDNDALQAYESIDGYQPGNPSTDNGGILLNVLNAWRKTGIAGRKIAGYAMANIRNRTEIMQCINIFGGAYAAVMLPISAQTQDVWSIVPDDGGVWGGHCVPILDYDENGLTCITWGQAKRLTWNFFDRYFDEFYPVVSQDFIEAGGVAPNGFNLGQLTSDIALIH